MCLNAGTISTNNPTTTPTPPTPPPTPPSTTTPPPPPRLRRFISLTGHCSLAPIHTALAGTNWQRHFPTAINQHWRAFIGSEAFHTTAITMH